MIWGDIGLPELVPFSAIGYGKNRVARIVLAITQVPNGIGLVDEIENGIHHSTVSDVWLAIVKAAENFNTQVFATAHCFECLRAAHDVLDADDLRIHRLETGRDGESKCVTLSREGAEGAILHGFEIR